PVCPPYRLDLKTFEREDNLIPIHDHITGKGHGQVITEAFFGYVGQNLRRSGSNVFGLYILQKISAVQYFKQQLVPLLAVLSRKGGKVFHGGSFQLLVAK